MAKLHSVFELHGTLGGVTFVNSRTYGKHIRTRRGTHRPATVNKSFKENSGHLIGANRPAQIIKKALDPHRKNFACGQLWQRLVSVFRQQSRTHGKFDFLALKGVDIHKEYPLHRLISMMVKVAVDHDTSVLLVTLDYHAHPEFTKAKYVDGYRFTVIALYPSLEKNAAITTVATSSVISLDDKVETQQFTLPMPAEAEQYLLCVKLEGMEENRLCEGMPTKGMNLIEAGIIVMS
jgi:hypothetical protein